MTASFEDVPRSTSAKWEVLPGGSRVRKVETLRTLEAVAALRPEWEQLLAATGASVFNSWEWLFPWLQRVAPNRALFLLTARALDGQLLGLFPLALETRRLLGRGVRRLAFWGESNVGSDYLDVLARPGFEDEVMAAFVDTLQAQQGAWDLLDFQDLHAESSTLARLAAAFAPPSYVCETRERYLCPFEPLLSGETFDALLKRTGRRDNYLRRRKWLERQPGYRIEKTEAPVELPRVMAEFFRLHSLRWAADGGSQGIGHANVEAFHRDATQLLAERGRVRVYTLWVSGLAVASVYGILHDHRFLYYQSGYDPAWRSKSVGLVLIGETFKDALEGGCREFDFLRGTEAYKSDWTTQQRRTVAVRIYPRGGLGAWFVQSERVAKRARDALRGVLPANLTERIRRLRRRLTRPG